MAHVSDKKKKTVEEFTQLMDEYPVVAVVNLANLATRQLQKMRVTLRDNKNVLKMSKKRLMKIAFSKSKKENITELENHFKGMPALIFTKENPFKLYSDLQKTKSKAPAKAGQIAPKNIVVTAGPTSFSPGPIIGQLGKFGIKAGIEGGKIAIKQDSTVAKEGDEINAELAGILLRLGVEPMEIGLDLTAAYEDGQIYTADLLYIDEKEYARKIATSYSEAINLAVYVAYPTDETTSILVANAARDARNLSVSEGIITDETKEDIIRKAYSEMISLSNNLPEDALSDELKAGKASTAAQAPVVSAGKPDDNKEEPEKEEPKEEEAAAGLGSLFG